MANTRLPDGPPHDTMNASEKGFVPHQEDTMMGLSKKEQPQKVGFGRVRLRFSLFALMALALVCSVLAWGLRSYRQQQRTEVGRAWVRGGAEELKGTHDRFN